MNSQNKNNHLISVIVNCYNGEKFLKDCIESILKQTYNNWEIIFWDNMSQDNSKKILESFKDERIRYFKTEKFTKLYEARNLAIKKARGDYITFLDVDDWWLPKKLEAQINIFKKDNTISMVYSNFYVFDDKYKKKKYFSKKPLPTGRITQKLLKNYQIGILSVMIKKEVFDQNSFKTDLDIIGDFDFFLNLSTTKKIECAQEPLAVVRIHGSNLSTLKIDQFILELSSWIKSNKDHHIYKKYDLSGASTFLQCLKIKKYIIERKLLDAIKEIFKKPLSLRKLKFIRYLFLPVNRLIKS
jgi:glycosyltransferase involved in cell wall biosynthesis